MIFASLGNSPVPFYRMAEAVDNYAKESGEEVVIQSGKTVYPFKYCTVQPFMDKETFTKYLKNCEVAILQGGWGTISEASDLGVKTVIIPRIKGVEHHHDQEQLVHALEAENIVIGCYDTNNLKHLIEKAKTFNFKHIKRGDATPVINKFLADWSTQLSINSTNRKIKTILHFNKQRKMSD